MVDTINSARLPGQPTHTNFGFWIYDFGLRNPYGSGVCSPGSGATENRNGMSDQIGNELMSQKPKLGWTMNHQVDRT
jgi:hypothetical protein